ncbi:MAG: DUF4132 domain-containing protein [Kiloniellales bacterium]|nr:DUF4132 domain-containing protein [Kiloniellales bacterium]
MDLGRVFRRVTGAPVAADPVAAMAPTVRAYLDEAAAAAPSRYEPPKIEELETGRALLEAAPGDQVLALRATFDALCAGLRTSAALGTSRRHGLRLQALKNLASRLLRRRLPYRSDDLEAMIRALAGKTAQDHWLPTGGLLRAVELHVRAQGLDDSLRAALLHLRQRAESSAFRRIVQGVPELPELAEKVARLLEEPDAASFLRKSPWGTEVGSWLSALEPGPKAAWTALLAHAATARGRNRPPRNWDAEAAALMGAVGAEVFAQRLEGWLAGLALEPENPDPNAELIRGLIWIAAGLEAETAAPLLGGFTERCFKKVPEHGARSVLLGNAALFALGALPAGGGVAELSRLKGKLRYPSARKQVEKVLQDAAARAGKTPEELEEMAVPDFGLDVAGCRVEPLGDFQAVIRIAGAEMVALTWRGPDGKERKTVPAAVKRDHPDGLKAIKRRVKEIKDVMSGQSGRLERLFLAERRWPLAEWRKLYLDHPLLSGLSRRLIWRFDGGEDNAGGLAEGNRITDHTGAPLDWLDDETRVSLWHPIDEPAERVLAWRRRLADLEITQPFKQGHREIYVLTEAERQTEVYSNRFAAHILKQHQFRALCQQRGWRYDFQGQWDSYNVPDRPLERHGLSAQFWVEPCHDDATEAGVYLYLSSDQVRFVDPGGTPVALAQIPPLVFSELMRDVDLFVGVCSLGNDPTWADGGVQGHHMAYWRSYSFGELSETARTRCDVLAAVVPRLKIADRCDLEDRYLKVRGRRRSYKIHLGSGNVLMAPNDQYLCIVRGVRGWDTGTSGQRIRLPFEGDAMLSLILSKAFLLAEDDKITDRTILSQIGR